MGHILSAFFLLATIGASLAPPRQIYIGGGNIPLFFSHHQGDHLKGRVLLLSGAGSSWRIWRGLTDYLTDRGYDVWAAGFQEKNGAGFDEFVTEGISSILARIPGRPSWVGFDAGGLALLAHLSAHPAERSLERGVCIGCPIKPEVPYQGVKKALDALRADPQAPVLSKGLVALLLGDGGLEESQLDWFRREGGSEALIRDAIRWFETGCWCSSDGTRDYAGGLVSVTSPVLFLSGQVDTIVPPWLSFPGFASISSREKLFRIFGRVNGYSREYGHLGLVLGTGARTEVFPVIAQWLEKGPIRNAWLEDLPF